MKMHIISIFISCVLLVSCSSTLYPKRSPQVFYSRKDFAAFTEPAKKIKNVSRNLYGFSNHLTIKYTDGTNEKVLKKNIWGYSDSDSLAYRYDKSFYEIYAIEPVNVYKQTGRFTNVFFSKTLDSGIYKYNKRNLKKYFDEATYQKVLEYKRLSRML